MAIISDRVFEYIKRRGMTQREFSQKTGIPQSTISDWKSKRLNPSADKILIICEVLEITPYDILSDVDNKREYGKMDYIVVDKKSDIYAIIESYGKLSESSKNKLVGYISGLSDRD